MIFALLVNDSVAAAIIGASFTACIGLIAWVVLTLGKMTTRLEVLSERVFVLEGASNGSRPRVHERGHE